MGFKNSIEHVSNYGLMMIVQNVSGKRHMGECGWEYYNILQQNRTI